MIAFSKQRVMFVKPNTIASEPGLLACRLCLATNCKLYNILNYQLGHLIQALTGIVMSAEDGRPQHVCGCCRHLLGKYFRFRECSLVADHILRSAELVTKKITTEFISSIDRVGLNLTFPLVITKIQADYTCPGDGFNDFRSTVVDDLSSSSPRNVNGLNEEESNAKQVPDTCTDNTLSDTTINRPENNVVEIDLNEFELTSDLNTFSVSNEDSDSTASTTNEGCESDEKELIPPKYISKETKVDLDIVLSKQLQNLLVKFFKKQVKCKTKKTLTEEQLSQLERVKQTLVYNKCEAAEAYEAEERRRMENRERELRRASEARAEFERRYRTRVEALSAEQQRQRVAARREAHQYAGRPHRCDLCYTGFATENSYKQHLKLHNPKYGRQECAVCRYRGPNRHWLRKHMEAHLYLFRCTICQHETSSTTAAKKHHERHEGHRYPCGRCDKSFL